MMPLREIAAHLRACYPAEGCGLIFEDAGGALRFAPIANIAGSAEASSTSRRTGLDGYVMEPKALLTTLDAAEQAGGRLYAIVHSHPEVGAYFSKEDRDMALGGGDEPLWPGVRYLVVSVRAGSVDGARLYTWDAGRREFAREEVADIIGFS